MNKIKMRALRAFFKQYLNHEDGYHPEAIGIYCAEFHEILNTTTWEEEK